MCKGSGEAPHSVDEFHFTHRGRVKVASINCPLCAKIIRSLMVIQCSQMISGAPISIFTGEPSEAHKDQTLVTTGAKFEFCLANSPAEAQVTLEARGGGSGELQGQLFLSLRLALMQAGWSHGFGTEVGGRVEGGAAVLRGQMCRSGPGQRHLHPGC